MELKQIVSAWLKENGYDGLYNPPNECRCRLGDLMPCGEPNLFCKAGHEEKAPPGSNFDFLIYPGKVENWEIGEIRNNNPKTRRDQNELISNLPECKRRI